MSQSIDSLTSAHRTDTVIPASEPSTSTSHPLHEGFAQDPQPVSATEPTSSNSIHSINAINAINAISHAHTQTISNSSTKGNTNPNPNRNTNSNSGMHLDASDDALSAGAATMTAPSSQTPLHEYQQQYEPQTRRRLDEVQKVNDENCRLTTSMSTPFPGSEEHSGAMFTVLAAQDIRLVTLELDVAIEPSNDAAKADVPIEVYIRNGPYSDAIARNRASWKQLTSPNTRVTPVIMPNGPGVIIPLSNIQSYPIAAGRVYSIYVAAPNSSKVRLLPPRNQNDRPGTVHSKDDRLTVYFGVGINNRAEAAAFPATVTTSPTAAFAGRFHYNTIEPCTEARARTQVQLEFAVDTYASAALKRLNEALQDTLVAIQVLNPTLIRYTRFQMLDLQDVQSTYWPRNNSNKRDFDKKCPESFTSCELITANISYLHSVSLPPGDLIAAILENDEIIADSVVATTSSSVSRSSSTVVASASLRGAANDSGTQEMDTEGIESPVIVEKASGSGAIATSNSKANYAYVGESLATGDFVFTLQPVPYDLQLNALQRRYMEQTITKFFMERSDAPIWKTAITVQVPESVAVSGLVSSKSLVTNDGGNETDSSAGGGLRGRARILQDESTPEFGYTQIGMKITAQGTSPGLRSDVLETMNDHNAYLSQLLSREFYRPGEINSLDSGRVFADINQTSVIIQPLDFGKNITVATVPEDSGAQTYPAWIYISTGGLIVGILWLAYVVWNDFLRDQWVGRYLNTSKTVGERTDSSEETASKDAAQTTAGLLDPNRFNQDDMALINSSAIRITRPHVTRSRSMQGLLDMSLGLSAGPRSPDGSQDFASNESRRPQLVRRKSFGGSCESLLSNRGPPPGRTPGPNQHHHCHPRHHPASRSGMQKQRSFDQLYPSSRHMIGHVEPSLPPPTVDHNRQFHHDRQVGVRKEADRRRPSFDNFLKGMMGQTKGAETTSSAPPPPPQHHQPKQYQQKQHQQKQQNSHPRQSIQTVHARSSVGGQSMFAAAPNKSPQFVGDCDDWQNPSAFNAKSLDRRKRNARRDSTESSDSDKSQSVRLMDELSSRSLSTKGSLVQDIASRDLNDKSSRHSNGSKPELAKAPSYMVKSKSKPTIHGGPKAAGKPDRSRGKLMEQIPAKTNPSATASDSDYDSASDDTEDSAINTQLDTLSSCETLLSRASGGKKNADVLKKKKLTLKIVKSSKEATNVKVNTRWKSVSKLEDAGVSVTKTPISSSTKLDNEAKSPRTFLDTSAFQSDEFTPSGSVATGTHLVDSGRYLKVGDSFSDSSSLIYGKTPRNKRGDASIRSDVSKQSALLMNAGSGSPELSPRLDSSEPLIKSPAGSTSTHRGRRHAHESASSNARSKSKDRLSTQSKAPKRSKSRDKLSKFQPSKSSTAAVDPSTATSSLHSKSGVSAKGKKKSESEGKKLKRSSSRDRLAKVRPKSSSSVSQQSLVGNLDEFMSADTKQRGKSGRKDARSVASMRSQQSRGTGRPSHHRRDKPMKRSRSRQDMDSGSVARSVASTDMIRRDDNATSHSRRSLQPTQSGKMRPRGRRDARSKSPSRMEPPQMTRGRSRTDLARSRGRSPHDRCRRPSLDSTRSFDFQQDDRTVGSRASVQSGISRDSGGRSRCSRSPSGRRRRPSIQIDLAFGDSYGDLRDSTTHSRTSVQSIGARQSSADNSQRRARSKSPGRQIFRHGNSHAQERNQHANHEEFDWNPGRIGRRSSHGRMDERDFKHAHGHSHHQTQQQQQQLQQYSRPSGSGSGRPRQHAGQGYGSSYATAASSASTRIDMAGLSHQSSRGSGSRHSRSSWVSPSYQVSASSAQQPQLDDSGTFSSDDSGIHEPFGSSLAVMSPTYEYY